jgi:hypothetical protein
MTTRIQHEECGTEMMSHLAEDDTETMWCPTCHPDFDPEMEHTLPTIPASRLAWPTGLSHIQLITSDLYDSETDPSTRYHLTEKQELAPISYDSSCTHEDEGTELGNGLGVIEQNYYGDDGTTSCYKYNFCPNCGERIYDPEILA